MRTKINNSSITPITSSHHRTTDWSQLDCHWSDKNSTLAVGVTSVHHDEHTSHEYWFKQHVIRRECQQDNSQTREEIDMKRKQQRQTDNQVEKKSCKTATLSGYLRRKRSIERKRCWWKAIRKIEGYLQSATRICVVSIQQVLSTTELAAHDHPSWGQG